MLTPRSATTDATRPTQRIIAEPSNANLREWIEAGVGYLPFLAWFLGGLSDTPSLAAAAYIVVAGMLVVRPQLGLLALLPLLPFNHPQSFQPHGPIFILSGVALGSVLVRCALGTTKILGSVRPALWCSLAFLAVTAFQLFLGIPELGGRIPRQSFIAYDQIFIILSVFAIGLVVLPGRYLAPYYAAFLGSFAIVAAVAILYFIEPRSLNVLGLAWTVPPNAFENRASGIIPNPNSLGLAMACGLSWIIVTAIWQVVHGREDRLMALVPIVPVAGLALMLSFSRASIAALVMGLVVGLARHSFRVAGAVAAAAVIAAVLLYPVFVEIRLGQTFGEASPAGEAAFNESDRLRTLMAVSAVEAFLDAPVAGHGFSTFNRISPRYSGQSILTSAHDMYLKLAAEQGLIGLSLLAALFVSMVKPIWRAGWGPWAASLAVVGAFLAWSFTGDSLGNAQTVSAAFFLMAAGVAQAGHARDRAEANARASDGPEWEDVEA